jgi:anti-sigma28 factor (negative regulator of flagellin synthesis)
MVDHCPPPLPSVDDAQSVAEPAAIDHAKVARLRRLIASGDYIIDPDRIAAAMIATDVIIERKT